MIGLVADDQLDLPLTQDELADATAPTPVHVNRTLQRMRKEGLIALHSGKPTVLDIPALEHVPGFDPSYLHITRLLVANA